MLTGVPWGWAAHGWFWPCPGAGVGGHRGRPHRGADCAGPREAQARLLPGLRGAARAPAPVAQGELGRARGAGPCPVEAAAAPQPAPAPGPPPAAGGQQDPAVSLPAPGDRCGINPWFCPFWAVLSHPVHGGSQPRLLARPGESWGGPASAKGDVMELNPPWVPSQAPPRGREWEWGCPLPSAAAPPIPIHPSQSCYTPTSPFPHPRPQFVYGLSQDTSQISTFLPQITIYPQTPDLFTS